jgi:hypothetical protein
MLHDFIELLANIFDKKTLVWLVLVGFAIPTLWVAYKFFVEGIKNASEKYYDLKLDLYKEITQVSATLATSRDADKIRVAAFRFDELYWGQLVLVEDAALEEAMIDYRALIANKNTQELEIDKLMNGGIDRKSLQNSSIDVARACFNSLQPSWLDQALASFRKPKKYAS